ncbi:fatty acid synthase alpha subunit Lsd1, partial [Coemansia sp. RSA 1085]
MDGRTTFSISHGDTTLVIDLSRELEESTKSIAETFVVELDPVSSLELHALFIIHCADHDHIVALTILEAFCRTYDVPNTNIHVVVQQNQLDEEAARRVLKAYYLLWNEPAARHCYFGDSLQMPALFAADATQVMAMFGGQPGTSSYIKEAKWLLDVYGPILSGYLARMSEFLDSEAKDEEFELAFAEGLDIQQWLMDSDKMPDNDYLLSAPVSMPLTGLIQLMQTMVLFKTLGVSPGEFTRLFKAAVGHSQGIAAATALSMLSDEQSFEIISTKVLGLLLLIGAVPQIELPEYFAIDNSIESKNSQTIDDVPRPMVYVRGLDRKALESILSEFNSNQLSEAEHVHLAVANSYDQFVVAGTVLSTVKLVGLLRSRSADPALDQSKLPFTLRRPVIAASYVDITVPYHCELLASSVDVIAAMAADKGWLLDAADMQIPVRACDTGKDIGGDITRYLAESICVLPVNWPQAIAAAGITHMVDFGTGGFNGFGQLAFKNVEGSGVSVICVGALTSQHSSLECKASLWQVSTAVNWLSEWGPQLQQTASGIHIDNQMQRVLGLPTVMVAGMTPTTSNVQLVAAISNAGYHVELAGGGMHSKQDLSDRINQLARAIPPGHGITLNCIYFNQKQWQFQFPALLQMRRQGLPITGLCIGGGVPSTENALDIIEELHAASIRHIAFKPSTAEAIRQVVQIAQQVSFSIILQWTGGRGGGHHSFEDFHQPILETYAAIRTCKNIVLVAGSGFGDASGSWPYITGDWSKEFGRAPMPFDGILLGSRVMIAKEAGTSLAAKELIKTTPGVADSQWHLTYAGECGGVTTLTSEYGELNHSLATRAIMFIRDMSSILSQPREKREALLLARKGEIISRLNSDYMRPWFGKKADGQVADLEDMTYTEVIDRAVELMYVKHQQRWAHPSYFKFVAKFADRAERRMCTHLLRKTISAELLDVDPLDMAAFVAKQYPEAATQLLASEDVQFFISMCKQRGQKPPPFVPVFDNDFGVLLLKDMTNQSEDLDAVIGQDPQRVCIQHGPVAAQYSTIVNEPVKDILDGIYHSHIDMLVERLYNGNKDSIPTVEYIGTNPVAVAVPSSVGASESDTERVYQLPAKEEQLPELDLWLQLLAGSRKSWLHALLSTPVIVQEDNRYAENYVRRLLRPRPERTVTIQLENDLPVKVLITKKGLELSLEYTTNGEIRLHIYHTALTGVVVPLTLEYSYCPTMSPTPIHGSKQRDDSAAQNFSIEIWSANFKQNGEYTDIADPNVQLVNEIVITERHSRLLCKSIGNNAWRYAFPRDGVLLAPIEFINIAYVKDLLHLLQSSLFGVGQLSVVHIYSDYVHEDGAPMLRVNDKLTATTRIDGLVNMELGKKLSLETTLHCENIKIGVLKSAFLSRSHYVSVEQTFEHRHQQKMTVSLPSEADIAALKSCEWFIFHDDAANELKPNTPIEICVDSEHRFKKDMYSSISTTGKAIIRGLGGNSTCVADINFSWTTATENPVLEYLRPFEIASDKVFFSNGGYTLVTKANANQARKQAPKTNWRYAEQSLDGNPFHLNPYVADYADLPGTITHGLWTSASTRAIVEAIAADGQPERIRAY